MPWSKLIPEYVHSPEVKFIDILGEWERSGRTVAGGMNRLTRDSGPVSRLCTLPGIVCLRIWFCGSPGGQMQQGRVRRFGVAWATITTAAQFQSSPLYLLLNSVASLIHVNWSCKTLIVGPPLSLSHCKCTFRVPLLVPTVDTTRTTWLLEQMVKIKRPVVLVGESGTSKTATTQNFLRNLNQDLNVSICRCSGVTLIQEPTETKSNSPGNLPLPRTSTGTLVGLRVLLLWQSVFSVFSSGIGSSRIEELHILLPLAKRPKCIRNGLFLHLFLSHVQKSHLRVGCFPRSWTGSHLSRESFCSGSHGALFSSSFLQLLLIINFSSRTTSMDIQRNLEANVEKRTKETYGPPMGKRLLVFMDDMNMPRVRNRQAPLPRL